MRALVLVLFALLFAGCADPGAPVEPAAAAPSPDEEEDAATAAGADLNASASPGMTTLYTLPDGSPSLAPPTEEVAVPVDVPFNSPVTGGSPEWTGTLPTALEAETTVTLRFFLTTSSVSVPARTAADAFGFPGIGVYFTIGGNEFEVSADGPDVLVRGDVAEIQLSVPYPGEAVAAGAEVFVEIIPYYSHVQTVADVQFLMGPEHLAAVVFEPAHAPS